MDVNRKIIKRLSYNIKALNDRFFEKTTYFIIEFDPIPSSQMIIFAVLVSLCYFDVIIKYYLNITVEMKLYRTRFDR